ncbi:MAG: dihydropteroate synthase [Dehalococcoidia bacterium]|nr:dihydropteroate synthase [Dehalococcoidia bacterium]
MSVAPVRVVPPGYGHLAGDPNAPYTVVFAAADEKPSQLAAAFGLRTGTAEGAVHVLASRTELEELAAALVSEGDGAGSHLRHFLEPETAWKLRTRELPLDRVHVMGILNLTEDSFSGDGVGVALDEALRRAEALREAGADIVDVGAESARLIASGRRGVRSGPYGANGRGCSAARGTSCRQTRTRAPSRGQRWKTARRS